MKSTNTIGTTDAGVEINSPLEKDLIRVLLEIVLEKIRTKPDDLRTSTEWIDRILPQNTIYPGGPYNMAYSKESMMIDLTAQRGGNKK